jgi:uncharacterized membrane protein (UPF0127 family)
MGDWARRLEGLESRDLDGGLTVHVARTYNQRRRGLARLDALPADHGLHILKCFAVHTFGMRFGLDLIWLDRRGDIVRIDRDVGPHRQRWCLRARSVVEVSAGQADNFVAAGVADGYTRQR